MQSYAIILNFHKTTSTSTGQPYQNIELTSTKVFRTKVLTATVSLFQNCWWASWLFSYFIAPLHLFTISKRICHRQVDSSMIIGSSLHHSFRIYRRVQGLDCPTPVASKHVDCRKSDIPIWIPPSCLQLVEVSCPIPDSLIPLYGLVGRLVWCLQIELSNVICCRRIYWERILWHIVATAVPEYWHWWLRS